MADFSCKTVRKADCKKTNDRSPLDAGKSVGLLCEADITGNSEAILVSLLTASAEPELHWTTQCAMT